MPSDYSKKIRKLFRQLDCAPAAFQVGADANDLSNPGCLGTRYYLSQFSSEVRIIQVRVCIVESCHETSGPIHSGTLTVVSSGYKSLRMVETNCVTNPNIRVDTMHAKCVSLGSSQSRA